MYGSTVFDQSTVSGKLSRAGTAILGQLSARVRSGLIRVIISTTQFPVQTPRFARCSKVDEKSTPRGEVSIDGQGDELLSAAFRVCAS